MVGEKAFRTVMGHFATGVTVVASRTEGGRPVGLTVNAFCSVSLDPPLILVCIHRDAAAHDPILRSGHFGVSILKEGQDELAFRFSREDPEARFRDLPLELGSLGDPLIPGSLAYLECRVRATYGGGDHSIVLGEVEMCRATEGEPLLFFRGVLGGLRR